MVHRRRTSDLLDEATCNHIDLAIPQSLWFRPSLSRIDIALAPLLPLGSHPPLVWAGVARVPGLPAGATARRDSSQRRRHPVQSVEPSEVAIESHPATAGLDRHRCEPRIGDEVAARLRLDAEIDEDLPMHRTRLNWDAMGLNSNHLAEIERLMESARIRKHTGMRDDPHKSAEHCVGDSVTGRAVDQTVEPSIAPFVL